MVRAGGANDMPWTAGTPIPANASASDPSITARSFKPTLCAIVRAIPIAALAVTLAACDRPDVQQAQQSEPWRHAGLTARLALMIRPLVPVIPSGLDFDVSQHRPRDGCGGRRWCQQTS